MLQPVLFANSNPIVSATPDLGRVTFNYDFSTLPDSPGYNVNLQLFLSYNKEYPLLSPRDENLSPLTFSIAPNGSENKGSFTLDLPAGTYSSGKAVLFEAGTNFSVVIQEILVQDLNLVVTTSQIRITKPVMSLLTPTTDSANPLHYFIPYSIKIPKNQAATQYNGLWTQIKGEYGFQQQWHDLSKELVPGNDSFDDYNVLYGKFDFTFPPNTGIQNFQAGSFDYSWKAYSKWVYPGVTFQVTDSWVIKADPAKYPSISGALTPRGKEPFIFWGNYGNYNIVGNNAHSDANSFRELTYVTGLKGMRLVIDPDQWNANKAYVNKCDQIVQNILRANMIPILTAQFLPKTAGNNQADRIAELTKFCQGIASFYKNTPIIFSLLNEPHEVGDGTWATWKPVLEKLAADTHMIAPNMILWGSLENWAKDGRAASANKPDMTHISKLVMHAYVNASDLETLVPAGLPYVIEEYHTDTYEFHLALQNLTHKPDIIMAWTYTIPGEDSIPLVASVNGAELMLNTVGQNIINYYTEWIKDGILTAPVVVNPVTTGSTSIDPALLQQIKSNTDAMQKIAAQIANDESQMATLAKKESEDVASLLARVSALESNLSLVTSAVTDTQSNVAGLIAQSTENPATDPSVLADIATLKTANLNQTRRITSVGTDLQSLINAAAKSSLEFYKFAALHKTV